jgi:hypothetical protein
VINHSQQPRKPTDNSMFSQIHTRVIIHETTGIMPCRGGGAGLLHSLSIPTRYRLFGRLEQVPTQITLMDVVKRPLRTRKRAPITSWVGGVSTGGLATTTWPRAQLRFFSCTFGRGLWVVKSSGFVPPGPPGNRGCGTAIPARPSATVADGLGLRVLLRHSNWRSAPPTRRVWALVQSSTPKPTTPTSQRLTPPSKHTGPGL